MPAPRLGREGRRPKEAGERQAKAKEPAEAELQFWYQSSAWSVVDGQAGIPVECTGIWDRNRQSASLVPRNFGSVLVVAGIGTAQ